MIYFSVNFITRSAENSEDVKWILGDQQGPISRTRKEKLYYIIVTLPPEVSHMDTLCDFEIFAA